MNLEDGELFRSEALEARNDFYKGPLDIYELPSGFIVGIISIAVLGALTFLVMGSYARKETAVGSIVATQGVTRLVAQKQGLIKSIVKDGTNVTSGQVIAVINSESFYQDGESVDQKVREAQQESADYKSDDLEFQSLELRQRKDNIFQRIEEIHAEVKLIDTSILLNNERITLNQSALDDLKKLANDKYVTQSDVRKQSQVVVDDKAKELELKRQKVRLRKDLEQSQSDVKEITLQLKSLDARINLDKAQAKEIALKSSQNTEHVLVAKSGGIFYTRGKHNGDAVSTGEEIGVVVQKGHPLYIELRVPSTAIGMIDQKAQVKVMIDAYPFEKFGYLDAKITTISEAAFYNQNEESFYLVKAELKNNFVMAYGQRRNLIPGMTLKADMILEKRTIMQWLLDPIRAKASRI